MALDYQTLIMLLSQIVWPLARLSGLMLIAPFFSSNLIPMRIRVVFTVTMAVICAPLVAPALSFSHFSPSFIVIGMQELVFGLLMGFILTLVFQVFILVGQIISLQAGLGFATMVDPNSHASVPLISQFYLMFATLLFLALNGHLAVIEAIMGSFKVLPIGASIIKPSMFWVVIHFSSWMLQAALLVALPALIALFLVNLSFGIIARVAPQLNLFSLGLPMSLLMGFLVMLIGLSGVSSAVGDCIEQGLLVIKGMLH